MSDDQIPAEWKSPITTPVPLYWIGLDHLEIQWNRTREFSEAPPGSDKALEYLFWRKNLFVWACCAIEGFINEEGVSWLGEEFYKDNIEKLGAHQKIAVLYALKYQRRLDSKNEVLKEVRQLFEFRNQLVHPKTRYYTESNVADEKIRMKIDSSTPDQLRAVFRRVLNLFDIEPDSTSSKS